MQTWMKSAMVLMVAGMLVGCMKMDQTLTINGDGSASVELNYGMPEATVNQMEMMKKMSASMATGDVENAASAEDNGGFDFNEENIRSSFSKMEQYGVKLDSVSSEVKEGWKYVHVKYSAKDLAALSKTEFAESSKMSLTKNADGDYVLLQKNSDYEMGDDSEDTPPEMKEMMMQQMLPMLKGMQIAIRVKVPGKIIESNATEVKGNEVAWLYDVDKDPSFITKASKMEDMKIVFSGKGLSLPEIQPAADVDQDEEGED